MKSVKHAFLLGSETQYPGVCVLKTVISPSFPLVVIAALGIWQTSNVPWPGILYILCSWMIGGYDVETMYQIVQAF